MTGYIFHVTGPSATDGFAPQRANKHAIHSDACVYTMATDKELIIDDKPFDRSNDPLTFSTIICYGLLSDTLVNNWHRNFTPTFNM